jgi:hypothetical protein
MVDAWT